MRIIFVSDMNVYFEAALFVVQIDFLYVGGTAYLRCRGVSLTSLSRGSFS